MSGIVDVGAFQRRIIESGQFAGHNNGVELCLASGRFGRFGLPGGRDHRAVDGGIVGVFEVRCEYLFEFALALGRDWFGFDADGLSTSTRLADDCK